MNDGIDKHAPCRDILLLQERNSATAPKVSTFQKLQATQTCHINTSATRRLRWIFFLTNLVA